MELAASCEHLHKRMDLAHVSLDDHKARLCRRRMPASVAGRTTVAARGITVPTSAAREAMTVGVGAGNVNMVECLGRLAILFGCNILVQNQPGLSDSELFPASSSGATGPCKTESAAAKPPGKFCDFWPGQQMHPVVPWL